MSRPVYAPVTPIASVESWDSIIDQNFTDLNSIAFDGPFPFKVYANEAALPTASNYDQCVAAVENIDSGWLLYISDGLVWAPIPKQAPALADSTAPDVTTLVGDFNTLLSNLRSSGVIAS